VIKVQGNRSDNNGSQSFSGGLVLERYNSNGSSGLVSGNTLGTIYFGGNYNTTPTYTYPASISAIADANWSSTSAASTALVFFTGSTGQALGTANVAFGTERMRIDSSGNVGIGATTVAGVDSRLRVVGGSDGNTGISMGCTATERPVVGFRVSDNSLRAKIEINDTNGATGDRLGFFVYPNPTVEMMSLRGNGNVGIGTTSPAVKLHVYGTGGQNNYYTNGDTVNQALYLQASGGASGDGGQILFGAVQGIFAGIKGFITNGTGPAGALCFQARGMTGNVDQRMMIDSTGAAITGTLSSTGNLSTTGDLRVTDTGSAHYILIGNQDSGGLNKPNIIQGVNGTLSLGYGTSWSSSGGGTLTAIAAISSTGLAVTGALSCTGALSKGSGSFRIEHPLPSKSATHQLVHSFIEGPKCDLIYRGKINLVDGKASVNIDTDSTMTEGTFEVLCANVQCFTSNESGWGAIRGKVTGNILTIEAQDAASTDNVSWMVIGERKDKHIMDTDWTDENGRPIVEPLKPVEPALESN
jgi:hypothetical protein